MKTLAGANPSLSIINKTKANQENTVIKTKPVVKTGLVRQPKRETKSVLMSIRINAVEKSVCSSFMNLNVPSVSIYKGNIASAFLLFSLK